MGNVSVTISWPAVSGATGYTTKLSVPRIGSELHNSPSDTTSFTITLQDGDRVHQETITSGVTSSYSKDFVVGSLAPVTNLVASFDLVPGIMVISGLADINPGPNAGQSQVAGFNGTHAVPTVLAGSPVLLGDAKFNGQDEPFYIKFTVNPDGSYQDFILLLSNDGGSTGEPAFRSTEPVVFNIKTGVWPAVSNDNTSGYAQGGTMQLSIPDWQPPQDQD